MAVPAALDNSTSSTSEEHDVEDASLSSRPPRATNKREAVPTADVAAKSSTTSSSSSTTISTSPTTTTTSPSSSSSTTTSPVSSQNDGVGKEDEERVDISHSSSCQKEATSTTEAPAPQLCRGRKNNLRRHYKLEPVTSRAELDRLHHTPNTAEDAPLVQSPVDLRQTWQTALKTGAGGTPKRIRDYLMTPGNPNLILVDVGESMRQGGLLQGTPGTKTMNLSSRVEPSAEDEDSRREKACSSSAVRSQPQEDEDLHPGGANEDVLKMMELLNADRFRVKRQRNLPVEFQEDPHFSIPSSPVWDCRSFLDRVPDGDWEKAETELTGQLRKVLTPCGGGGGGENSTSTGTGTGSEDEVEVVDSSKDHDIDSEPDISEEDARMLARGFAQLARQVAEGWMGAGSWRCASSSSAKENMASDVPGVVDEFPGSREHFLCPRHETHPPEFTKPLHWMAQILVRSPDVDRCSDGPAWHIDEWFYYLHGVISFLSCTTKIVDIRDEIVYGDGGGRGSRNEKDAGEQDHEEEDALDVLVSSDHDEAGSSAIPADLPHPPVELVAASRGPAKNGVVAAGGEQRPALSRPSTGKIQGESTTTTASEQGQHDENCLSGIREFAFLEHYMGPARDRHEKRFDERPKLTKKEVRRVISPRPGHDFVLYHGGEGEREWPGALRAAIHQGPHKTEEFGKRGRISFFFAVFDFS